MKTTITYIFRAFLGLILVAGFNSCEDFLDRAPMSSIAPEGYFNHASQLANYANRIYPDVLPAHGQWDYGFFNWDNNTDSQAGVTVHNRYTPDLWKTGSGNGSWTFEQIYRINFGLAQALPQYETGTIGGNANEIKHYLGELYFLRACEYLKKLQAFGDFPIVKDPLPDNMEILREAAVRKPQNEVARFIIEDLDKAAELLGAQTMATTRINKDAALLLKSRVALFEGTWLKYFKGTAFVPAGTGWPGTGGYTYSSGSIDSEITWFLTQATTAASEVAEKYKGQLTANTGYMQQSTTEAPNPFYEMYASENLSNVPEVLMWRQYARGLATHNVNAAAGRGNYRVGLTRGQVQNFLMADGTPVYTHGTYADGDGYYKGDKTIADVRANRDTRLSIFLKEPGQKNVLYELENNEGSEVTFTEPVPTITLGDGERGYATGYALHKGGSLNRKYYANGGGYTGTVVYRAAEALLNYMEAQYEKDGSLDAKSREYWQTLRRRAKVSEDIDATIAATDMTKEAEFDWAAYSGGQVLADKTLYNIRRERRSELFCEGFRYNDLRRWRSMDQLKTTPYDLEGFHLWNTPMEAWYNTGAGGASILVADGSNTANVSNKSLSEYLRPFQRTTTQNGYNGMTWRMAYYFEPVSIGQMQKAATNPADLSTSTIYQNPYWPSEAAQSAKE